jgi:hypothetical protein
MAVQETTTTYDCRTAKIRVQNIKIGSQEIAGREFIRYVTLGE